MTLNPASKTTDSSDSRGGNLQETDRKTANSGNSNDAVVKSEKVSQAFTKSGVERNFRQAQPVLWWCALVGPAIVGLLILTTVFLIQGPDALKNIGIAIAATFLLLGRFVILMGGDPIEFLNMKFEMSSGELFWMVTIMDFLVAFFVAYHMGILFKAPFFGTKLEGMVSDGRFILKHQPWIRNVAFMGLVLFVIFPSSTTGSIGGSIFGRLLGMRRERVVAAILVGSLLGNGVMLVLAQTLKEFMPSDNIWLKLGGVGGMLLVLVIVERYYQRVKKKYIRLEEEAAQSE